MTGSALNNNNDLATLLAAMNNGGMGGGMWNNPFAYMMLMYAMGSWGGNGFGNNGTNNQINALQGQIQDNHNSDLVMGALNGNADKIAQLSQTLNLTIDQVNQGLCGIRNGITELNGTTALSGERVQNSISQQTGLVLNKIGEMGAAQLLNNERQTNQIQAGNAMLNNTIQSGFAGIQATMAQEFCNVRQNSVNQKQEILNYLVQTKQDELQNENTRLRDELVTQNQTNAFNTQFNALSAQVAALAQVVNTLKPATTNA